MNKKSKKAKKVIFIFLILIIIFLFYIKLTIAKNNFNSNNKIYTAAFYENGATSVETKKLSCVAQKSKKSCTIKSPKISRKGWKIIGWSTNSNSKTANIKVGKKIKLTKNQKYYAITKKEVIITFNINKKNYICYEGTIQKNCKDISIKRCSIYNNNSDCKLKIPFINRTGYQTFSFKSSNEEEYYNFNKIYSFSKDEQLKVYFDNHNSEKGYSSKYNTFTIDNLIVEIDTAIPNNLKLEKNLKTKLREIKIYYNFLFKYIGKMRLLTEQNYKELYKENYSYSGGITIGPYYSSGIDIKAKKEDLNIGGLIHELSHRLDRNCKAYDNSEKRISESEKFGFKSLYLEYKSKENRALREYSYINEHEFFADAMAYYFTHKLKPEYNDDILKSYTSYEEAKTDYDKLYKEIENLLQKIKLKEVCK